jgi:hypothetical protein
MIRFGRIAHAHARVCNLQALLALAMATAALAVPASALGADSHATPSTFASLFSAAQGGDTVYLASGSYGSWSGGAKASMVTVAAEPGASPTMSGGNFGSGVRNITIRGVTFTGPVEVAPPSAWMGLVFDGDTWGNVGHAAHEGRLSIVGGGLASGSGVQVKNSTFGPGGCSDGIQDSSRGTEIGPGNEFKGIVQGNCAEHADAIQPYDSNYTYIHDNYMHDNEQGIMSPDGVSTGYRITNNVIHTSTGYPCMHIGDSRSGTITHNVCRNGSIRLFGGNENVASQSMVVQNNANGVDNAACTGCTVDHNQSVSYTGGSGRCAYATASPKGTGSDGTDIGLNSCGASPPPPADTTAPDTTITSAPADPSASTSASIGFNSSEAGSTFECKLDTGAYASCTSPKAYSALSIGSHTFSVRATDAAANTDASPATWTWTIDATAPPPSDHQPVAGYVYAPTTPTAGQAVSLDASSATCVDAPCSYAWADDGDDGAAGTQWPLGSGKAMTFTFQGAGVKNVRLVVTDVDGDTDSAMKAITVAASAPPADTTAPNTTITAGPSAPTNDSTPTFAFSSTEAGSTFACRVDGGTYGACGSPWTTTALGDGAHSVSVRATDTAGNTDGTPATRSFTVDTAPPHATIASAPPTPSISGSGSVAFTVNESGASSECRLDGGGWAACTSPYQVSGLGIGSHTVDVRSTDAAGNVESPGASATWLVVLPVTPAGLTVTLTAPGADATVGTAARFAADASSGSAIRRVEFWVDSQRVASDTTAPYSKRVDLSSVSSGTHTVAARAFDASGQTASSATVVRISRTGGRVRAAAVQSAGHSALLTTAAAGPDATRLAGQAPKQRILRATLARCGDRTAKVVDRARLRADGHGRLSATRGRSGLCVLGLSLAS